MGLYIFSSFLLVARSLVRYNVAKKSGRLIATHLIAHEVELRNESLLRYFALIAG